MSTLLLRFSAPLQSWGTEVRYDVCTTRREPTCSGVMGMIAAAMGCSREAYPTWLNTLKFGVRVDREGQLLRDYHTAHSAESAYVTNRYYLSDALFLVGLEGEKERLQQIADALKHPYYPLYLGRRSCPPAGRLVLGIRDMALREALTQEPLLDMPMQRQTHGPAEDSAAQIVPSSTFYKNGGCRLVMTAEPGMQGVSVQRDVIFTLSREHRRYGFRGVSESILCGEPVTGSRIPAHAQRKAFDMKTPLEIHHDPMSELEE